MKRAAIFIAFCLIAVPATARSRIRTPGWHDPVNWYKLEKKMTERQVAQILGKPVEKETIGTAMFYLYQPPLRNVDGSLATRPEYGFVRFAIDPRTRTSRRPMYCLTAYKPANADLLPTPEIPIDPLAEPIVTQKNALETPPPAAISPVTTPTPPRIIDRTERRKRPPTPPAAVDEHTRNSSRYFFGAGILFAVGAIGFSIANGTKFIGK